MARSGLGRGLDVLLGERPTATAATATQEPVSSEIPLEKVIPNRQQPRTHFDQRDLQSLAESIRKHGVLQPIVVSRAGERYELVAGHRRVLAARLADRTSIPAVIREEVSDRLELALIENLQRADLNAIETARAYKLLMETYDLTQEQLAERVGRSRTSITNTLRALQAPQILQDAVTDGKISEGHLRSLVGLSLSDAIAALGEILARSLSVRDTEALVRKMVRPPGRRARPQQRLAPDTARQVDVLRARLGTRVEVRRGKRGGRITIHFFNDEDFDRLYAQLTEGEV